MFVLVDEHKILRPGQTRWLSLENCIARLLEQLDALKLYFTALVLDEPTTAHIQLLKSLKDPFTKPFFEFMIYTLGRFNELLAHFQSETPMLFEVQPRVNELIVELSKNFMKSEHLEQIENPANISLEDETVLLPLNDIYIGNNFINLGIYFIMHWIHSSLLNNYFYLFIVKVHWQRIPWMR